MGELLRGRIQAGKGDACRWLGRFNEAYRRKLQMPVYPGSLNLALDNTFDWFARRYQPYIIWFGREEYGGERDVLMLPCDLVDLDHRKAFLWTPTTAARNRPDPWVVELVCDVKLRETYSRRRRPLIAFDLPGHTGGHEFLMAMSKPTWQFQYSVETDARRCFAWRHWTNIANWKDPPAEFELDGPFAPGSKLTSRVPGQEPRHSVIREVHAETAASIEMLLAEAVLRFDWRLDELAGGGTRITQRLTLYGENAAAYAEQVAIFEKTVPEGMKKLATVFAQAEADSRHAGSAG